MKFKLGDKVIGIDPESETYNKHYIVEEVAKVTIKVVEIGGRVCANYYSRKFRKATKLEQALK